MHARPLFKYYKHQALVIREQAIEMVKVAYNFIAIRNSHQ